MSTPNTFQKKRATVCPSRQSGALLIEALIAILIFSVEQPIQNFEGNMVVVFVLLTDDVNSRAFIDIALDLSNTDPTACLNI